MPTLTKPASSSGPRILAIFSICCGLMPLAFALTYVGVEMRRRSGPFGIAGEYSGYAIFYLVLTLIPVALGIEAVWKQRRGGTALVLSLIIGMFAAYSFPTNYVDRARSAHGHVRGAAKDTGERMVALSEERGHFPESEAQFRETETSLRDGWSGEGLNRSPYARDGQQVPYKLVYLASASGPHLPGPPGPEPSLLYCAISPDLRTLWITATALEHEGGKVIFVPDPDAPERPLALRLRALEKPKTEDPGGKGTGPVQRQVDPPPPGTRPEVRG